jgi:predicted component of type VI protein secretion system
MNLKVATPFTSTAPPPQCALDVLKSGVLLERIALTLPTTTFGRGEDCSVVSAHDSCSRLHAALSYFEGFFYLCDQNSQHGVFLQKKRIAPGKWLKLLHCDSFRFGDSSRTYVLDAALDGLQIERPAGTCCGVRASKRLDFSPRELFAQREGARDARPAVGEAAEIESCARRKCPHSEQRKLPNGRFERRPNEPTRAARCRRGSSRRRARRGRAQIARKIGRTKARVHGTGVYGL